MAPRQGSPLSLSSPRLVSLDKSPLDPAASSPDSTRGTNPLSLEEKRRIRIRQPFTNNRDSSTFNKARAMNKENTQNFPVVKPASGPMPVPVRFTTTTTKLSSDPSTYSQETKTEYDGSSSSDTEQDHPILQTLLDLTSTKCYGGQDHDLRIKQPPFLPRVSVPHVDSSSSSTHQEVQRMKQFQQRIHQEQQSMSARQHRRLETVRALKDIIISASQHQCHVSMIEQLTKKMVEHNNNNKAVSPSSPSKVMSEENNPSQLKTWRALLATKSSVELPLEEVPRLKSHLVPEEQGAAQGADTIQSLREQNQALAQELLVAQQQKAAMETEFHAKIAALSRDRHELIYRLIEMEERVAQAEKAKETTGSAVVALPASNQIPATDASEPALDRNDDNACSDQMNSPEGKENTNQDSQGDEQEVSMLRHRVQELEQGKEVMQMTQAALEASIMEANEICREVETSLAVATEELEMVRTDFTALAEELETVQEEANHLSGARHLLLEELDRITARLNDVLHHRNQLETENTSLRQSRDRDAMELAENMALLLSQHIAIESVVHRLREVRLLFTHDDDDDENTDGDSMDVNDTHQEMSSDDKESSNRPEKQKPQWLDSALVLMEEMEVSLNACLTRLSPKLNPSEANESKEETPKGGWSKFSVKGLFGRKADVKVGSL